MVNPIISGTIMEARDQVRMTDRLPERWAAFTFFSSLG